MFTRPAIAFVACLSALATGCQSTSNIGSLFPQRGTAVVMEKPSTQSGSGQVLLAPGAQVQWQVQPAQYQAGLVKSGTEQVGPDGTVVIGPYGNCRVAGLTLDQATMAMEKHLAAYMKTPNVQLSMTLPYNQAAPTNPTDIAWRSARTTMPSTLVYATPTGQNATGPSARPGVQTVTLQTNATAEPAGSVIAQGPQVQEPGFFRRVISRLGFGQKP